MTDEQPEGIGHNSREEVVRNSLESYYQLDKQINALTEKHLASPREKKSAITKRLRKDYQMPANVFKARYASYRLERQAQDNDDEPTIIALQQMAEMVPFSTTLGVLAGGNAADDFQEDEGPTGTATFDHPESVTGAET